MHGGFANQTFTIRYLDLHSSRQHGGTSFYAANMVIGDGRALTLFGSASSQSRSTPTRFSWSHDSDAPRDAASRVLSMDIFVA